MGGTAATSDDAPVDPSDRPSDETRQAFLAAIVESSEDAIVGKDLDGIITSWNPAAEQLYGYTAEEAIGRPISILIPPSRPDELPAIMDRLRRGERIQHFETTRIRKDGSTLEVSLSLSPVHDARGRIVGAAGIGREITDRRTAERERDDLLVRERAAREQLDTILGGVADGVIVQSADGTFVYANDTAARKAGFDSAEAYLGAGTYELSRRLSVLDAEGRPFPYDQLPARRAFHGDPAPEMVVQFRRADTEEIRWSRTQSRIVRGADGQPLAISIFHDITDEMRARDRLRFLAEAGAQLAGSLDVDETLAALVRVASTTLADWAVVILIDEDGVVQHIASAHRDPAKEPLTRRLHERQLQHASGATLLWQSIQSGEPLLLPVVTDEMMVQSARDEGHLELLRALGLSSLLYAPLASRGRVQGVIALFMAETGRRFGEEDRAIAVEIARRASLALENARLYREAHDAVQARDEFLSIASHELRTPVTAISGVAQVALRSHQRGTLDDARLTRMLEQLIRGSQRLVTLTEDLLDVSRLQTGRFELRPEDLDLPTFVADFVDRFGVHLGEEHQVTLEVRGAGRGAGSEEPGTTRERSGEQILVQADSARLEQVLANLLSNAVKYSPDGGTIAVAIDQDETSARIAVRDLGIGLPAGSEEAIFEPFGRAPNAAHRHIQGLGLGLYICRQIVERHGGRIWAESPGDGHGTTIQLWLPLATQVL
jgi:PAS domain S-box-containing protein